MVKENIIIPKENYKKVEEVREIERQENYQSSKFAKFFPSVAYCADGDDIKEGTKKVVQGEVGVTTAIDAPAGAIMGVVAKPVGKAAEGIGDATGIKEIKSVGEGTQDAVEEPLKKVGDTVEEVGEGIKEGFEDLGDKIGGLFD